jgi:hypothetical protein
MITRIQRLYDRKYINPYVHDFISKRSDWPHFARICREHSRDEDLARALTTFVDGVLVLLIEKNT